MATERGRAKGRAERDAAAARGVRERIDGFTPDKEEVFLAELERSGCITDAARVAGISKTTIERHRRFRPAFAAACKLARIKARGPLEAIAYARAVEGGETRIIRGGKLVEVRIRPSDAMLKTLMQAADPEKYGRVGGVSPAQVAKLRAQWEKEQAEAPEDEERKREVVERLIRKTIKLREREFKKGMGLTVDGQLVPIGYGPISPDAVPMVADPLNYSEDQEVADFFRRCDEEHAAEEARRAGDLGV
jgi:hypothetical protein